jgi:hypothetical protein
VYKVFVLLLKKKVVVVETKERKSKKRKKEREAKSEYSCCCFKLILCDYICVHARISKQGLFSLGPARYRR